MQNIKKKNGQIRQHKKRGLQSASTSASQLISAGIWQLKVEAA